MFGTRFTLRFLLIQPKANKLSADRAPRTQPGVNLRLDLRAHLIDRRNFALYPPVQNLRSVGVS